MNDDRPPVPAVGKWMIRRIEEGPLFVSCHVSNRWLQFNPAAHYDLRDDDDLLSFNVMTLDQNDEPRKLCEMIVARGDLQRALDAVPPAPNREG